MFNAELVVRRSPGEMVEPTTYPDDPAEMARNYGIMLPLVQERVGATRLPIHWFKRIEAEC